jgi:hypothetical protein
VPRNHSLSYAIIWEGFFDQWLVLALKYTYLPGDLGVAFGIENAMTGRNYGGTVYGVAHESHFAYVKPNLAVEYGLRHSIGYRRR